jgi:hypothetical protein
VYLSVLSLFLSDKESLADIDETFTLLKNEGFSIIEDRPVYLPFWENGCKYFNILGPDGERLEFCQIL